MSSVFSHFLRERSFKSRQNPRVDIFQARKVFEGFKTAFLWKRLALTQMCNRRAIRANVNKASIRAKRGECLAWASLLHGKRHVGKNALLAHGT